MLKFKKLLVVSLAIAASVFPASICANAAQIESLSIVDKVLYSQVSAGNSRLFVAERNGALLVDAFFTDIGADGIVELPVGEASDYTLYLWDKESLAPISATYKVVDGVAYLDGSTTPVPEYSFSGYSFDQDDDVMIVSSVDSTHIKGFKAGVEATYALAENVEVVGLSDQLTDVVPGSVVLVGTDRLGNCAALELLASIGLPVNEELFKADYGVYAPSDDSTEYENVVNVLFSKSGNKVKLGNNSGKTYLFESGNVICYRVGIAMDGETPVITASGYSVSGQGDNSVFKKTSEYNNYVYLRVDNSQSKTVGGVTYDGLVTQCVVYAVPKNFNPGGGDDEYSPIFSLKPIVIID